MLLVMSPLLRYLVIMVECCDSDCPILKQIVIHKRGICQSHRSESCIVIKDMPELTAIKAPHWKPWALKFTVMCGRSSVDSILDVPELTKENIELKIENEVLNKMSWSFRSAN